MSTPEQRGAAAVGIRQLTAATGRGTDYDMAAKVGTLLGLVLDSARETVAGGAVPAVSTAEVIERLAKAEIILGGVEEDGVGREIGGQ